MTSRKAIDFGVLPYLANMQEYTYSFWIKRTGDCFFIVSKTVDYGTGRRGHALFIDTAGEFHFQSFKTPTDGDWDNSASNLPNLNQWYHVLLTYDNSTATADPAIYIDGTPIVMTETGTPAGTSDDDSDCPLTLFNLGPDPAIPTQRYYYSAAMNSDVKHMRIYNRILTSAEIAELAASADDYTVVRNENLQFMGFFAPSGFIEEFTSGTIIEDDYILDVVHRAVGIPYIEITNDTFLGDSIPGAVW